MAHEIFFRTIRTYAPLSETAQNAWDKLLRRKRYAKGDDFVTEGQIPTSFAFVVEGLFYQHYTGREGDRVVKYFFPEHRIAASVSATLAGQPSVFTITAIEDSVVLEYSFAEFKKLVSIFPDIAAFYIRYMEQHWILEKEPEEISFRHDTALERYQRLVRKSPTLVKRLKQHHSLEMIHEDRTSQPGSASRPKVSADSKRAIADRGRFNSTLLTNIKAFRPCFS